MNTYTQQPCEPESDPAEQPKDPGSTCDPLPQDQLPKPYEPTKCEPDPECCCETTPPPAPTCFDELIAAQSKQMSEAEAAKAFKTELESLLSKATAAKVEYTPDKYDALVKDWDQQDQKIAAFIKTLVCAIPCWRCIIECFICPLLYETRYQKQKLWGDGKLYSGEGKLYSEVHSLSDLRYWHDRNRQAKWRDFERIKGVLAAWEKPVQTITTVLANNKKLLEESGKLLSTPDAMKVVYDVFLRLVPMHLLIAPPASSDYKTKIPKKYTELCECDKGEPDDCCGPDVGVPSVRLRLLGPQPYLINPKDYFTVICCLAKERYLPAKNAYATAQSAWESVDAEFKRLEAEIVESLKPTSIEQRAKASFPKNCDWLKKKPAESAL